MLRKLVNRIRRAIRSHEGFTLLELMVVVLILAILAAGGLVGYNQFIERAVNSVAQSTAGSLATMVRIYEIENGKSLADSSKTEVEAELKQYVQQGATLTVLASGEEAPTGPSGSSDQVWVQCPQANSAVWKVWVQRSGRLSKEATFNGELAANGGPETCAGTTGTGGGGTTQ